MSTKSIETTIAIKRYADAVISVQMLLSPSIENITYNVVCNHVYIEIS